CWWVWWGGWGFCGGVWCFGLWCCCGWMIELLFFGVLLVIVFWVVLVCLFWFGGLFCWLLSCFLCLGCLSGSLRVRCVA
ncbi:hypothetical protein, partial [Pseudomonas syringae group genomosp. 7]|uniref:hypothetical protein n=1 Tax=Pseudomonas syringae group genomosp. 7 TaxID=251699 RepID=UPI00376F5355